MTLLTRFWGTTVCTIVSLHIVTGAGCNDASGTSNHMAGKDLRIVPEVHDVETADLNQRRCLDIDLGACVCDDGLSGRLVCGGDDFVDPYCDCSIEAEIARCRAVAGHEKPVAGIDIWNEGLPKPPLPCRYTWNDEVTLVELNTYYKYRPVSCLLMSARHTMTRHADGEGEREYTTETWEYDAERRLTRHTFAYSSGSSEFDQYIYRNNEVIAVRWLTDNESSESECIGKTIFKYNREGGLIEKCSVGCSDDTCTGDSVIYRRDVNGCLELIVAPVFGGVVRAEFDTDELCRLRSRTHYGGDFVYCDRTEESPIDQLLVRQDSGRMGGTCTDMLDDIDLFGESGGFATYRLDVVRDQGEGRIVAIEEDIRLNAPCSEYCLPERCSWEPGPVCEQLDPDWMNIDEQTDRRVTLHYGHLAKVSRVSVDSSSRRICIEWDPNEMICLNTMSDGGPDGVMEYEVNIVRNSLGMITQILDENSEPTRTYRYAPDGQTVVAEIEGRSEKTWRYGNCLTQAP